jgi:uncharacterized protein (TIGR01777 family)
MPAVLISGGTGLIGRNLTHHLIERGYETIILTRQENKRSPGPGITYTYWNIEKGIIDPTVVRRADCIIHLAGAGVMDMRWTDEYKKEIVVSRTRSAELMIQCLRENNHHVSAFISASAIGWYGQDPKPLASEDGFTESDQPANDFLGTTCVLWEAAADLAALPEIRVVKLRTGIVLSNDGGAFREFKNPLRFGVASILGNGKQVISWIHMDDLCRMYCEAIENHFLRGTYNAVAPGPVSQKTLVCTLARKMRNTFFIPLNVPAVILKLIFGERSIEILKSATVSCKKIKATGFTFLYPSIQAAADELLAGGRK